MARQRELLSLVDIADETGISYATLRNYALKYGDEIPSEGSGRNTRYPRLAVKVFQRLRKESKPGRKPANASLPPVVASPAVPIFAPLRQEAAPRFPASFPSPAPAPAAPPKVVDNGGIEKELVAMRSYLASIAESLKLLVSAMENSAPATAAPALASVPAPAAAEPPAAPAPATAQATAQTTAQIGAAVPLPELREGSSGGSDKAGHRRLQSMPKVWGQRGRRPE